MPLKSYGVLKGRPVNRRLASGSNAHYQVHVVDETTDYRIAINVASALDPPDLSYLVDSKFRHAFIESIGQLPMGWSPLERRPGGPALDFIRCNLFNPEDMAVLPFNVPGPDNDLNEKLDHYIQRALADESALVYAFGERWGPESGTKDKIFGFAPGNGVHDIHMNQGNEGSFVKDDGVYQDGALLLHFPGPDQWVGIFLKFQSQSWHTDDTTGHRLEAEPGADQSVRIVAALVNPAGEAQAETVTLLNTTAAAIDLAGWTLLDRDKNALPLSGTLPAGETVRIPLRPPVMLPNKGGLITLLTSGGLRVDGVSYTAAAAKRRGCSTKF